MNQLESVKELQWYRERLDFKHILDKRKLIFLPCLAKTSNTILQTCLPFTQVYMNSLGCAVNTILILLLAP